MTKITKKDMFTMLLDVVATADLPTTLADGDTPAPTREDFTTFIEKQIDQLAKKSSGGSRKPTKDQIQNDEYRTQILDVLTIEDRPLRISEIREKIPALEGASSQKMVMLMRPMILDGKIEKTYIKKVSHYCAI